MHPKENAFIIALSYIACKVLNMLLDLDGMILELLMSKNMSTMKELKMVILIGLSLESL
jgi:hypothetical protein